MDKRLYALVAVIVGIAFGIIGDVFFNGKFIGLSAPLYVLLLVIALFGMKALTRQQTRRRNLWLLIPLGFFAVMLAVRADPTITFWNALAVLVLAALVAHYFPLEQAFDRDSTFTHAMSLIEAGIVSIFMPIGQAIQSIGWVRAHGILRARGAASVLRGVVIAVPILIVFGVLLASADQVFADYLRRLTSIFQLRNWNDVFRHGMVIVLFGWIVCGGLAYAVLTRPGRRYVQVGDQPAQTLPDDESAPPKGKKRPFTLNLIEAGIVLGSVVGLFAAFVLIQFTYFFGGQSNITFEGFTYAEYARRGFFELVAVSVLTLGLMLWLDYVSVRQNAPQQTIFRVLALSIVALTGVMLWSAHLRLSLYEQVYGYSHLRLYPHVFMLWLAALYAFFALMLFRVRENLFSLGVVICALGYLTTLNLINVDASIMGQNIARYRDGHGLDIGYLRYVSADAVPVVLDFYLVDLAETGTPEAEAIKQGIGQWLRREYLDLERKRANYSLLSAHSGRDTAWALLSAAEDRLPEYDPYYYLPAYTSIGRDG
jgi:hypothetical protein